MCHARLIHAGLWGVLMTAAIASATTVQFDIVALENNQPITTTNPTITVTPGAQVDYEVTALVSSAAGATTPDNNGLGYFRFDILTDLTVTQPAVTGIEASINSAFNFLVSLGTPTGDDILTVRAAQNTLSGTTALLAGVAEGTSQVIVGGVLNTPTVEGTYHVVLGGTLEASVFAAGGTSTLNSVTPTVGPGFTITVAAASSNTGSTDTTGTTTTDQTTTTTTDQTTSTTTTVPSQQLAYGAVAIGLAAITFWAFMSLGVWAGAITLVIALATALAAVLTTTTTTG